MKQLLDTIASMKTMAILMLIFAVAIGYATIIENDYGTMTAQADVYNALWFEFLLGILAINLILNIFRYKMFTKQKASIFLFHIAFLIILLGATITRYVGYEGSMHIREGSTSSSMVSRDTYFTLEAKVANKSTMYQKSIYFSKRSKNSLEASLGINDKNIDVKLIEYIPDAIEIITDDIKNGKPMIQIILTSKTKNEPIILSEGEYFKTNNFILDFNSKKSFTKPTISIFIKDNKPFIKYNTKLTYLNMDTQKSGILAPNNTQEFSTKTLFQLNDNGFILRSFKNFATKKVISNPNASPQRPTQDAFRFNIKVGSKSKEFMIYGESRIIAKKYHTVVDNVDIYLSYGAKNIQLPFSIYLKKFQLDRYPGSMSPASYASEVILIDKEEDIKIPYRIFMNNILEHRGYRFFQASYDMDEKGTILSVNHDPGTLPTYIGYLLLAIGMFWSLFSKGNRFEKLADKAKKASSSVVLVVGLLVSCALPSYAMDNDIKTIVSFDKQHSQNFAKLIIQDSGGRMKPINTIATEILAKVYRDSDLKIGGYTLDANQVILGMMMRPDAYRYVKMIRTKDKAVNKLIGVDENTKYVSFADFFEDVSQMKGYKLAQAVDNANRKEPKYRDMFDKAVLKIDERVNIVYMVYTGSLLKIWPKPDDINNKWFASIEALENFKPDEAQKVRDIAVDYFSSIENSLNSGDWSQSDKTLSKIIEYQKFYGASVYPYDGKIQAEIFYNKAKIFETLYPLYFLVGFILLIFSFSKILKPTLNIDIVSKGTLVIIIIFFIAHTIGLGLRWYISGHAPWSNGYESMIYIGWATVLAGFMFSKKSPITMASTSILTGLILFVAHLNWMNPQVTNLVPVLNSYWLSIHVATITASYGFLGLGALLGFITIILFILKTKHNEKRLSNAIKELNAINEMGLMIGLALLTIGNFLGGVWANESWGRYWGWDPKETWALVTILVYTVVVHVRFIKSIYSEFNFAVIALLAYSSVIMTYFGVNYYLAGLHSYAKGDPVPIPDFVPITYGVVFIIIAIAFKNRKLAD
jgi:cytochrome c-type biogenesis protein CcsB